MLDYLFIKVEKNYYKLKISEILYVQAEKKYVHIVTSTKSHLILTSISQIEKLLPRNLFCRIHRSYIISLDHTERFNCEFAYVDNKKIPVSEHYKNVLKNAVITLTSEENALKLDDGDVDKLLSNLNT
jgi:DNA-binding LytR/AlgR family response regulator